MFGHPLWLVGFRPFFTLAFASAVILPVLWALVFSGALALPSAGLNAVQWHAHEMLFGFGWAVLGGFLLTASKNWVKTRGMHGGPLAFAASCWVIERFAVLTLDPWSIAGFTVINACAVTVIGYVLWTLIRHRKTDFYRDNGFFVIALPLLLAAKNLVLSPQYWNLGAAMSIGVFRVAFAVMFERTITEFMKNAMATPVPRRLWLDMAIKALVLAAVFEPVLPPAIATAILAGAGTLLLARLFTWKPLVAFRRFDIGIMYVGYLGLVVHFALMALRDSGVFAGIGTLPVHTFTFLTMGMIIPWMLIRICQGHTGRKLVFTRSDRAATWIMAAAAFFRLVATQLWPTSYSLWIALSAIGWSACFAIVGARVAPFLWKARVDGRVH